MVLNVVLHPFGHEAVHGYSRTAEPLKDDGAMFIIMETAPNSLQLPMIFSARWTRANFFLDVFDIYLDYLVGVWYLTLRRYSTA